MVGSGLRRAGLSNHTLIYRTASSILTAPSVKRHCAQPWHGLPPEIRSMIWEFALFSEEPIVIGEVVERIDFDETSFYGHAKVMKPHVRLDLVPFLLVAPSEQDLILDAFYSNTFRFDGVSSSIHWFLDARLPPSGLLRISSLHLSDTALLNTRPGNSDTHVRTLAAFMEWRMNIHFLALHIPLGDVRPYVVPMGDSRHYVELWFKLAATMFFKRMIAGVDLRWTGHPVCQEPEEIMCQQYLERYDVLDGGGMNVQAIMPGEIDNDVLYPPVNQVKLSLFNEYYRLKPFTALPGRLPELTDVRDVPLAEFSLLFRHRNWKDCEKEVVQIEERLDSGNYDELEEKAAIHPIVVPHLKERIRRAQRLLRDMQAQTEWATQQKQKLCEGICNIHRNVRVQHYHKAGSGFRIAGVRNKQRRP
ncbi:hypothetical protein MBLNU457_5424t2 [Dothideomycetes sp. NU457]